jgi:hypothetical protein
MGLKGFRLWDIGQMHSTYRAPPWWMQSSADHAHAVAVHVEIERAKLVLKPGNHLIENHSVSRYGSNLIQPQPSPRLAQALHLREQRRARKRHKPNVRFRVEGLGFRECKKQIF